MRHQYPAWKYALLAVLIIIGLVYAAPNLYGESPAVQILPRTGYAFPANVEETIQHDLQTAHVPYQSIRREGNTLLVRFADPQSQLKAKELLLDRLGENYIVALNLAPKTPTWLETLGAKPMKLGLDLRGGVHFLINVDVDSAINRRVEAAQGDIRTDLRDEKIRYRQMSKKDTAIVVGFDDEEGLKAAQNVLQRRYASEFDVTSKVGEGKFNLVLQLKPTAIQEIRNYTVEQTIGTLRNRVNELGVAEAVVQRQGLNHVVVELPGIQDTARAKDILGKTATLEFHLYANEESGQVKAGAPAPPGTKWYTDKEGQSFLLKKRVILTGESITGASVGSDDRTGRPAVHVRVGGGGLPLFKKATKENIGTMMGVVYVESKPTEPTHKQASDGTPANNAFEHHVSETLISLATIQSALGSQFQITGLTIAEAQDLSLLLRSGALPATISIVEERTVGPSLGQENIRLGVISIEVGLALVVIAMLIYYSVFGIIANIALLINVILLVAILSMIGATLTLPGMAGIVLTVGMAVDANVLIFERIREELRNGMSPQGAIHSGFDRALATIIDANLTTLIVGIILFSVGTGPVKGFAVTLCIGILTSMITAITITRAIVNLIYGGRQVKQLRVGI